MNKHFNAWWAVICLFLILMAGGHAMAAVEANRAPVEDLVAIKGIGPATSRKIVEARQQRPFSDSSRSVKVLLTHSKVASARGSDLFHV
jgi:hypothetical protein